MERLITLLRGLRARVEPWLPGEGRDPAARLAELEASLRRRAAAFWSALRTRGGLTLAGMALLIAAYAVIDYATLPPPLPGYAQVRAAWRPSEAWLYDRDGQLIDSARVDFAARRLGWTPLDRISPVTREYSRRASMREIDSVITFSA